MKYFIGILIGGREIGYLFGQYKRIVNEFTGVLTGTGLGIAFLKHLSRTRLLLHLVDLGQNISAEETATEIKKLELELDKFSNELSKKERWMVFNKTDLISDVDEKSELIINELEWQGPIYKVSAATGENMDLLMRNVMHRLKELNDEELES